MDPLKTLWMGNLRQGTDQNYIREIFNQLSKTKTQLINFHFINIDIKLLNIRILFKEPNKKGSAFIEFETPEIAQKMLKEFNGKIVNGHLLKLNWTRLSLKNINNSTNNNMNNNINNNNKNNDSNNNNNFNIHNKNKKFTVSKIHFI